MKEVGKGPCPGAGVACIPRGTAAPRLPSSRKDRPMSDPHHGHGAPALPFTDADWAQFHKDDVTAGKAIILLMTGIFLLGVAMYTRVALASLSWGAFLDLLVGEGLAAVCHGRPGRASPPVPAPHGRHGRGTPRLSTGRQE